jgi:hypothetical protein
MFKINKHHINFKLLLLLLLLILSCIILLFLFIIYILYFYEPTTIIKSKYELEKDGIKLYTKIFTIDEIKEMKEMCEKEKYQTLKKYLSNHSKIKEIIGELKPIQEYELHDYIFIIKKSNIHTCHRDNNGSIYNKNQKYPSYTLIIYLEKMDKCLGVIPQSHKLIDKYNWNITKNPIENIQCSEGDIIMFDANTIHTGTIENKKDNNVRIQMKISHPDDINILSFYQKYNKMLNEENVLNINIKRFQQNISCMFPVLSDMTQNEHKNKARGDTNTTLSYLMSGNNNFYNFIDVTTSH